MLECPNCHQAIETEAIACPYCHTHRGVGGKIGKIGKNYSITH